MPHFEFFCKVPHRLPASPIPADSLPPRRQEGHRRRRRFHPHHLIQHAQEWNSFQDLGANYFDNRNKNKQVLRLVNRLEYLGFDVQMAPKAA